MRTTRGLSRLLGGAAVAVLVLSAAACGGGGGKTTTTTASAVQWADGVCSSFTTWQKSLESIRTEFTSQPSQSQLRRAGRQVEKATETLSRSLRQLGAPDTADGEAAKKNIDQLATSLENGMNTLKQTLNGKPSILSQISTITATLSAMAADLKLAGGNLKHLAPGAELERAFHQAGACRAYLH